MSTINVTNLSGRGGATPNLPDGANITGVATATTFSGTLDGSLKTTGTPTLGLGVTINSSGLVVSGVATAGVGSFTTVYGDGSNLTGVGETIAPWSYNPDVNDTLATVNTGIGVTFNKKVEAGSGTATLKIVNAGAAGTTIQSWGVSSCTFAIQDFTLGSLVSDLTINQTYQVDIPSGFIVDSNETSYVGTAWTFTTEDASYKLYAWGQNLSGMAAQNSAHPANYSSPIQIPGIDWGTFAGSDGSTHGVNLLITKSDGTLWGWGNNEYGQNALGRSPGYSSPIQVGSNSNWSTTSNSYYTAMAINTSGELWVRGFNGRGQLAQNSNIHYSSPVQIPGTTWSSLIGGQNFNGAIKTNGTLWLWGRNDGYGSLGDNTNISKSSPVQVPGTTWRSAAAGKEMMLATKTDGTLWGWGSNGNGQLAQNSTAANSYSSPVQIPGTSWSSAIAGGRMTAHAVKTDGTLWAWGTNGGGQLGVNNKTQYSSPVQIPGTTWGTTRSTIQSGAYSTLARKTDGTLWSWGYNANGELGQNNKTKYSSPVQIPGTDWIAVQKVTYNSFAVQKDLTP